MRIRITKLGPYDTYRYPDFIGATGTFILRHDWQDGWYAGNFRPDDNSLLADMADNETMTFFALKYEEIA